MHYGESGRAHHEVRMKAIRLIPHEECFEVRHSDGRPSKYFYFDVDKSRRSVTGRVTREKAEEGRQGLRSAREMARAE
jgi:hypothetical protein